MNRITAKEVLEILNKVKQSRIEEITLEMGRFTFQARKSTPPKESPPAEIYPDPIAGPPTARLILAPRFGFFRQAVHPGDLPLVKLNQCVEEDTPVGFIQVLEKMDPVPAGIQGRIVRICVADGKMVEYREPLFLVEESREKR